MLTVEAKDEFTVKNLPQEKRSGNVKDRAGHGPMPE